MMGLEDDKIKARFLSKRLKGTFAASTSVEMG